MLIKFIEKELKYTGLQLSPHWIYRNFNLQGDTIVAFSGECDVKISEMVDIEDVIKNEPIYSRNMLSFISEQFNIGLIEGVLRQRLLISTIKEALELRGLNSVRNGDDLYINGKKLTVSIATKSLTSVLIHTGINIESKGTPIGTVGLKSDLGINDVEGFAREVMMKYSLEIDDIIKASTKVRGV